MDKYKKKDDKKIRILVVPGHDNEFYGTRYKTLKEADLNADMAEQLIKYLERDGEFHVFSTRNRNGYFPFFENYFKDHEVELKDWKFAVENSETNYIIDASVKILVKPKRKS